MTIKNPEPGLTLSNVVRGAVATLFERLDRLHKQGIHDTEVIRFLRAEGLNDVAAEYIEWSGALDPDAEDDNTTMDPAVPDPGDAPSYEALDAGGRWWKVHGAIVQQLKAEGQGELYFNEDAYDGLSILDGPVNLSDLTDAVVKALEQAIAAGGGVTYIKALDAESERSELNFLRGERKSLIGHLGSWESQGHTTVGIDFLRRHLTKGDR